MAARNVKTGPFEGMDTKMPSNTLKRNPKNIDLTKADLLKLLSILEGELQARDVAIAAHKTEKAKQLLYQAKYGRFGLGDPFQALQRDSICQKDNSFDEAAVKAMYDNQLLQLENLIETQRKAQQRMRDQLVAVEKRYHKVLAELEDEKRKHAQDTEQGDNVTYMLEKERERLKNELDFDKGAMKKLEKELKKANTALEEEKETNAKQKEVAIMLIKERKKLLEKLIQLQARNTQIEACLADEQDKTKNMAEGLSAEGQKHSHMEALMEKQLHEFDVEKEQLKAKLKREESKNKELSLEVDKLKLQVEQLQRHHKRGSVHLDSDPVAMEIERVGSPSNVSVIKTRSQQPKVFKNTPPNTPPEVRKDMFSSQDRDGHAQGGVSRRPQLPYGSKSPERALSVEKPTPAEKPVDVIINKVNSPSLYQSPAGGATTIQTTGGARIQMMVGPNAASRKPQSPQPRGVPPPVPPNKPQGVILTPSPGIRKDGPGFPATGATASSSSGNAKMITISKDKIVISGESGATSPRPHSANAAPKSGVLQPGSHDNIRKPPSQSLEESSPEVDFLGPEMADLQELLVSMVTGTSESNTSIKGHPTTPTPTHQPPHSNPTSPSPSQQINLSQLEENITMLASHDINQPIRDENTILHLAALYGHFECLKCALGKGSDTERRQSDKQTALHLATIKQHNHCVALLLANGAEIDPQDSLGWTPLHHAVTRGHAPTAQILLEAGADVTIVTEMKSTAFHCAVDAGYSNCLEVLVTCSQLSNQHSVSNNQANSRKNVLMDLIGQFDEEGLTAIHKAAAQKSTDCMQVLKDHELLDIDMKDEMGRTVLDIATQQCKVLLQEPIENITTCRILVELEEKSKETTHVIGQLNVQEHMTWSELDEQLSDLFLNHLQTLCVGLRPRKPAKTDSSAESPDALFTIGVTLDSIKFFAIGSYTWSPGTPSDKMPHSVVKAAEKSEVSIRIFGFEDGCQDAVSYETLIPVSTLQNYIRLVEQYKNVIFYGPKGTGKSFIARKLAQCIQTKEGANRKIAEIHLVPLSTTTNNNQLMNILIDRGCLVPTSVTVDMNQAPILVLDDLDRVHITTVFKDLLPALENRNSKVSIRFTKEGSRTPLLYNLHPSCYVICTLDRARPSGLDITVQQCFRWVHFRNDQEPMKFMLHRHLYRKLLDSHGGIVPSSEDSVYKAAEWCVCFWQRLNEGLAKLALNDIQFGPCNFINCPVEPHMPKTILRWLNLLWNHSIAPTVSEAVIKGAGQETSSGGQQKVASTALYVLMQRAVVNGCPLSGQEKEKYLSSFHGSNELDIKMKNEKKSQPIKSSSQQNETSKSDLVDGKASTQIQVGKNITSPMNDLNKPQGSVTQSSVSMPTNGFQSTDNDSYGNTIFALSGIPARVSVGNVTSPLPFQSYTSAGITSSYARPPVTSPVSFTPPPMGGAISSPVTIMRPPTAITSPISFSRPLGGVTSPITISRPPGSITSPLSFSRPPGSITSPLSYTRPGSGITSPLTFSRPPGGIASPLHISRPPGSTYSPVTIQRPPGSFTPSPVPMVTIHRPPGSRPGSLPSNQISSPLHMGTGVSHTAMRPQAVTRQRLQFNTTLPGNNNTNNSNLINTNPAIERTKSSTDPRRALSPDLYKSPSFKDTVIARRAYSPGPDFLANSSRGMQITKDINISDKTNIQTGNK